MRLSVALVIVIALFTGNAVACGTERWPVKVGEDADAAAVDLAQATPSTIEALDGVAEPALRPDAARVDGAERTVYEIHAILFAYKREADGDYHLALRDGAGHTLIAEIPDPACVGAGSPFLAGIRRARSEFDARFKVGKRYRKTAVEVTVMGVGFFDFPHGQKGMAPNAIELHPVLGIGFGSGP